MKVTSNLKALCELAKKDGYKTVYTVVGAHMSTTYCVFYDIDRDILARPDGYDYGCGHPGNHRGMWTGHPNTRHVKYGEDIQYRALFERYRGR